MKVCGDHWQRWMNDNRGRGRVIEERLGSRAWIPLRFRRLATVPLPPSGLGRRREVTALPRAQAEAYWRQGRGTERRTGLRHMGVGSATSAVGARHYELHVQPESTLAAAGNWCFDWAAWPNRGLER